MNTLKISQLNLTAPLVVIVGPTAVGKTSIALDLAERLGGEIVSADSRLFYRGMDVGTAKPTAEERARVPHHLIDVSDPDETWSLPVFQRAAHEAILDIHRRERLPFLVGGTGQYVRAVTEGWQVPSQEPDHRLRSVLERWAAEIGPFELHRRLAVLDPDAASVIDARNVRRTVRALEVTLCTGRRFSEQRRQNASPYSLMIIGLTRPRGELYARIDERIDAMIASGFIEEVRRLLERGYRSNLPTMSAIGYREIAAYIRGEMPLEDAIVQMKQFTRRYVRQQGAWFGAGNPGIHWFEVHGSTTVEIEQYILSGDGWIAPTNT